MTVRAFNKREHREAIESLQPAQIRAIKRLLLVESLGGYAAGPYGNEERGRKLDLEVDRERDLYGESTPPKWWIP